MTFSKNMDMKHIGTHPRRKSRKAPLVIAGVIAAAIAVYAWMGSRDSEPQLSVVTYDCAPAMEMDMPIQQGVMQL
jgi:hypothetical protein